MTNELKTKPTESVTHPVSPSHAESKPGLHEKAGEGVDKVANRLAQKGTKAEKEFDNDNHKLFTK